MGMSYPTARDEQAAYWYLKLQDPHVSAEDIQGAIAWQAVPENRAAFERIENFWRAWPEVSAIGLGAESLKRTRPRVSWQVAASIVAIVSVALWALIGMRGYFKEPSVQEYASSVGQLRSIHLEDGTEVTLGGATSIRVNFAHDVRRVVISDGEALFSVAKDAARPFIVDFASGSAQALGTSFNVHRGPDGATITVLEGTVQVSPPSWRPSTSVVLEAGKQVAADLNGAIGEIRKVNPQQATSWHSGNMVFVDRTLRSIVADLNRYSSEPVTLVSTDIADMRVSGNIKLDQIHTWLRALEPAFGIDVIDTQDGVALVPRAKSNEPRDD